MARSSYKSQTNKIIGLAFLVIVLAIAAYFIAKNFSVLYKSGASAIYPRYTPRPTIGPTKRTPPPSTPFPRRTASPKATSKPGATPAPNRTAIPY